jgi:hypothetical protein
MDPNDPKCPDTLALLLDALHHGVTAVPFQDSIPARTARRAPHESDAYRPDGNLRVHNTKVRAFAEADVDRSARRGVAWIR